MIFNFKDRIFIFIKSKPPRFSAETVSPVAAFTNGGPKNYKNSINFFLLNLRNNSLPPRKMVPCLLTIMFSSDMAGT